jgi:hypothetical protein
VIHTSGHASIGDLKRLANAIAPKALVPIHTFEGGKFAIFFRTSSAGWMANGGVSNRGKIQARTAAGGYSLPRKLDEGAIAIGSMAPVTRRLRAMGIRDKPIAPSSPWQNGFAERLIGSIRRECWITSLFWARHICAEL